MQIRIVAFSDDYEGYKLKGYDNVDNISEVLKTLNYMKENELPLSINADNVVDTECDEYYIDSISMVFPMVGGEIRTHIVVYVEEV